MGKTIMFTGHCPTELGFTKTEIDDNEKPILVNAYKRDSYTTFIDQLASILVAKFHEGYDTFLTGGAQGMDMLAFWAVEKLREQGLPVENILCIPFRDYGRGQNWSLFGAFGKMDALHNRQKADEIIFLKTERNLSEKEAIAAMMERNHYMADRADLCIALLKTDKNDKGSTAECVRYCEKKSIPVMYLDTSVIDENGMEKLVITNK